MALGLSAILFVIYLSNVVLGASAGASFLTDVQEMVVLFAASIAFVAAILRREAAAKGENGDDAQ